MKNKIIILIIFVIAILLRFWMLGENPPSLTWDEAAWGYNAYSIGINGRDELGRFLPLDYLESFGDFKPPVYAYLDVLPVKIFGLSEFAVRFPSALFGVLTVIATYFLVKRIFWKSKLKESYALTSTLILAISPWHIMLSRAAFEANVATFFIVLGVWLFLLSMQSKRWVLLLSVISFVLSIYTFNTARIVVPILILVLAFGFRKELLKGKKEVIIAIAFGIILILPTLQFLLSPQASLRFKEVNIFSDINIIKKSNQDIENDGNTLLSKIIHNRRVLYSIEYLKHYFDNLDPKFLFIKGDGNPKFSTQEVGQMYVWDIPFILAGILFIFGRREGRWWLIPLWIIVGIIPAATARETPHALRIETILPTFQILSAYGFVQVLSLFKRYKKQIACVLFFFLALNFVYFAHTYFVEYPRKFSGEWQYGYKESIEYIKSVEKNYDAIVATNELGRPYIYYLFYNKTDPGFFRKTADVQRDVFGFVTVSSFGKYSFTKYLSQKPDNSRKILYVDRVSRIPMGASIQKTFNLLNGDPVLSAYTL